MNVDLYTSLIQSNIQMTGDIPRISKCISTSVTNYLTKCTVRSNTDIGCPGSGIGLGKIISHGDLSIHLVPLLKSSSIYGDFMVRIEKGISTATREYLTTTVSQTVHTGVGVGTSIGRLVLPPPDLLDIDMSRLYPTTSWKTFSQCFSKALFTYLSTLTYQIVITGPSLPGVSTGIGVGKLI